MLSSAQRQRASDAIRRLCESRIDSATLREELVPHLRRLTPFDGACIVTTDPGFTSSGTGFTYHNVPKSGNTPRVIAAELAGQDFNHFDVLGRSLWPVGILSEATRGDLVRSARYRELLIPQAATDELRAACVVDGDRWGSITLIRRGGRFDDQDAAAVARITGLVGRGMRRSLLPRHQELETLDQPAGLLLVGVDDNIQSVTPAGRYWLDAISDGSALPGIVQQALVRARLKPGSTPRLRTRARNGQWITVHGALLEEPGGPNGTVAIMLERARPNEITALLLRAYGLSEAERRVAELVVEGRSTKQMARALHLSPYTVQDHLKSVFEKAGVRSRRELVARIAHS